jgi:hypothetical protein
MDRECCLSILIAVIGGAMLLACGWWPIGRAADVSAARLERLAWRRIWLPILPALATAAWLCGWALREPDPVPEKVPLPLILVSLPFALLFARAVARAGRSLIAHREDPLAATVGLLRPWVVFSPYLAKRLNEGQIEAAMAHEQAHARHRDPLRIWLAQIATDLQWPWPQARERMRQWLAALELARDEEALAAGAEGSELADAILMSARLSQQLNQSPRPALTGEPAALKERIARLLDPPQIEGEDTPASAYAASLALAPGLLFVLTLGVMSGEQVVRALFWLAR